MKKTFAEDKFIGNMKTALFCTVVTYLTTLVNYALIGQMSGEEMISALALLAPYLMIITFASYMISSGTAIMISVAVGKGSREEGNLYFQQGILLSIGAGILLCILFLLTRDMIFHIMNIPENLIPSMKHYFTFLSLLPVLQMLNRLLYSVIC